MRLLDLFCGAGGAAMGYMDAGFHVTGVDIEPQPHYIGHHFIQADALQPPVRLEDFDLIHASPPCQAYSAGARMRNGAAKDHPRLVEPTQAMLDSVDRPYVIENVPAAPLRNPVRLCGSAFGLLVRRHRHFESNWPMLVPPCAHWRQDVVIGVYGDHPEDAPVYRGKPARRARDVPHAQEAMGMPWCDDWGGLKEAIPPAYTKFIGEQFINQLQEVS